MAVITCISYLLVCTRLSTIFNCATQCIDLTGIPNGSTLMLDGYILQQIVTKEPINQVTAIISGVEDEEIDKISKLCIPGLTLEWGKSGWIACDSEVTTTEIALTTNSTEVTTSTAEVTTTSTAELTLSSAEVIPSTADVTTSVASHDHGDEKIPNLDAIIILFLVIGPLIAVVLIIIILILCYRGCHCNVTYQADTTLTRTETSTPSPSLQPSPHHSPSQSPRPSSRPVPQASPSLHPSLPSPSQSPLPSPQPVRLPSPHPVRQPSPLLQLSPPQPVASSTCTDTKTFVPRRSSRLAAKLLESEDFDSDY